jgi:lon-related putative ATP-dependent protease
MNALTYKHLRRWLDPKQLKFTTTDDLEPLTEFIGQKRALEALQFGLGIKKPGYNLYAMGPSGIGKRSLIKEILKSQAIKEATPCDWCYIHNFDQSEQPIALSLPAGKGSLLQQDMKIFIEVLTTSLVSLFESDEYRTAMQEIYDDFNIQRGKIFKKINNQPTKNKVPHLYKERHEKEKALQLRFTTTIVQPLIQKLKNKYAEFSDVLHYLDAVSADVLSHVNEFVKQDEITQLPFFTLDNPLLIKYQINLLVDNSKTEGAPILFEENPSYSNLICRVEHVSHLGTLMTNFTLIKPGALHKANGGYLIIEARKLKKDKEVWENLKRALYARKIIIEPIEHFSESAKPISLQPVPVPLNIKIILLGDRTTFYSLSNKDADFTALFKVAVDFDEIIERNPHNIQLYARLIATIIKKENLKPFHASAIAVIIDHSSRLAEDKEKLSTHIRHIYDIMLEADYWASLENKKIIEDTDIKRAIFAKIHRMDRTRELYYEDIMRDFILIHTEGETVAQVNCLSVVKVGKFSYGHPTRLTATIRGGKERIIDIQREIKMAGPIHSKATLILANFLASRYHQAQSFPLIASLSFEQIYGRIDGDSASVAELCALLSAIAELPIKQSLAVTGSIDQHGEVQAIGGVNEKIEGFFDICKARGLTGEQGVLIPAVNINNLMLREDIVEAAKEKQFIIYAIETVDQAISLLTGLPAGNRQKNGKFPKNTVNAKVETKLQEFQRHFTKKTLQKNGLKQDIT